MLPVIASTQAASDQAAYDRAASDCQVAASIIASRAATSVVDDDCCYRFQTLKKRLE